MRRGLPDVGAHGLRRQFCGSYLSLIANAKREGKIPGIRHDQDDFAFRGEEGRVVQLFEVIGADMQRAWGDEL